MFKRILCITLLAVSIIFCAGCGRTQESSRQIELGAPPMPETTLPIFTPEASALPGMQP